MVGKRKGNVHLNVPTRAAKPRWKRRI